MQKRGLAQIVQVVLIVLVAIVLVAVIAFSIRKGLIYSANRVDPEVRLLQSEYSIVSAYSPDQVNVYIVVKRTAGIGTFPTVSLTDNSGNTFSRAYQGPEFNIFETATIPFTWAEIQSAGLSGIAKVEVYATTYDSGGEKINSGTPKDTKTFSEKPANSGGCGDGNVGSGEVCDGGSRACTTGGGYSGVQNCLADCSGYGACVATGTCGDGVLNGVEECDDGNTNNHDNCTNTCVSAECGDSILWNQENGSEECDDGRNGINTDGCKDDCTKTYCGDLIIQSPNGYGDNEICDGANLNGQSCTSIGMGFNGGTLACSSSCESWITSGCSSPPPAPSCGDNNLDAGEVCDDGGNVNCNPYPGCSANCQMREFCGNNIRECTTQEECDDGNSNPADGCNACHITTCGDNIVQNPNGQGFAEECDDGRNGINTDGCKDDCTKTYCGDGTKQTPNGFGQPEECDDGNSNPADGCNACHITTCGDNIVQNPNGQGFAEECDDGRNGINTDGCKDDCTKTYCGDLIIQSPNGYGDNEICDGANLNGQSCTSIGMGFNGGTLACSSSCESWITSGCSSPPIPMCGDGNIDSGEVCDDHNIISCSPYPGCSANCQVQEFCGNNIKQCIEECDGADLGGQSCTGLGYFKGQLSCSGCSLVITGCSNCGNGVINPPEQCDDADLDNSDECKNNCQSAYCGDGICASNRQPTPETHSNCPADCPSQPTCFVKGSLVETFAGGKPIEKLKGGDLIFGYNPLTSEKVLVVIKRVFSHTTDSYLLINRKLGVTRDHLMLVNNGWEEIGLARIGDRITTASGEEMIETIKPISGKFEVYTLEVGEPHTFIVDGFVVHNKVPNQIIIFDRFSYKWDSQINPPQGGTITINKGADAANGAVHRAATQEDTNA